MQRASSRLAEQAVATSDGTAGALATLGEGPSQQLDELAATIHQAWFHDLPLAPVAWGRNPPRRRLTHLRFGCYRRRKCCIEISPRLSRPWIATVFLEHVLFHEYCHHRQAMHPSLRREGVHSPRFRAWERAFHGYAQALAWERLALPWLLDDTPPPWYRAARSIA